MMPITSNAIKPRGLDEIEEFLVAKLAELLGEVAELIDRDKPFASYGLNSTEGVILAGELEDWLGCPLSANVAWEHPTIGSLATYLTGVVAAEARDDDGTVDHPLTPAQERIWVQDRLAAEPGRYQIVRAGRCLGALDVVALRRALAELVARHAALRTTFPTCGGRPLQRVRPRGSADLTEIDARDWTEHRLEEWLRAEAEKPVDLDRGPLLRVTVLTRRDDRSLMIVAAHHIVVDAWSMSVILRDLGALYRAETAGVRAALPELTTTPVEHSRRQAERLEGPAGTRLWAFWERQLRGELPLLDVLTDRPRSAVQAHRTGVVPFTVPADLAGALRALGNATGASLPTVMLAAFQVLLHRYSGQADILVGCETTGRTRTNVIDVVGYLANPVVIRGDLAGTPPFDAFLEQIRRTLMEALAHQELPLVLLVRRFAAKPDRSRTPLFQAMFTWPLIPTRNAQALLAFAFDDARARVHLGDVELEPVPLPRGGPPVDLHLTMAEADDAIAGELAYNAELYDHTTIERMARHLVTLLEAIAADPSRPVGELPLLPPEERRLVLHDWNATAADYGPDRCVHELFEDQAAKTPAAVAAVFEGRSLTYGELDEAGNRVAHDLRALGVGPDVCVGLLVERSFEMLVGLLGILKAGGAYLPLEPTEPGERLDFMLADAGLGIVVAQERFRSRLGGFSGRTLCIDGVGPGTGGPRRARPESAVGPRNLMYVMYTSGSTGTPKGVMVEHRGVTNRLRWMQATEHLGSDERVLHKTPFTFDISVWEIFAPLTCGGRVVIARPGGQRDPRYVADLIAAEEITTVHFVPSLLDLFLEQRDLERCRSVRRVISSGEALTFESQERFFARLDTELHNLYGPTEASIEVAAWRCARGAGCPVSGGVPIGRPIANARLYVLDEHLSPVPVGVPGELFIAGCCVARGYVNQPGLTAERFLPDPFVSASGERLYRTGDRVRWRPDGAIEFLGRTDRQIKLRGFRIELGEIEAVLRKHPNVREAVVVVDEGPAGDRRLASYVVPNLLGEAPDAANLRAFLESRLSPHMVPAVLAVVDALPLTANGKLDRRALQNRPAATEDALVPNDGGPRSPLEVTIASCWAAALGLDEVAGNDDFFDCGGDSLKSIAVAVQLSDTLGYLLPIDIVLRYPTVRTLAEFLASTTPPAPGPVAVAARGVVAQEAEPWLTVEPRSLIGLFATGELRPVDAAAVTYLPAGLLSAGAHARAAISEWCGDLPVLAGIWEPSLGRIALVLVPRFDFELYADRQGLLRLVDQAVELAGRVGARAVSLTGLLPSALDGGRALVSHRAERPSPIVSTGHASTAAAMVLTIERMLAETARSLPQERLAVLGLGSIGQATLQLLLHSRPHPAEILLCDVPARRPALEALRAELRATLGFRGEVRLLAGGATVPAELYDATLVLGATNAPDVLDIDRVAPGTIVVDDSAPHCFASARAMQRFAECADVLVTEGGTLAASHPVPQVLHVPPAIERVLGRSLLRLAGPPLPGGITGCVLSALLTAKFAQLPPTVGPAQLAACADHLRALPQLGFTAGPPHVQGNLLEGSLLARFRARFGGPR